MSDLIEKKEWTCSDRTFILVMRDWLKSQKRFAHPSVEPPSIDGLSDSYGTLELRAMAVGPYWRRLKTIYLGEAMSSIGCEDFFSQSGWHCQTIDVGNGPVTYISTPLTLPGGKPLDFYLIKRGSHIDFTDDGIALFALRSLGYMLGDKRNWKGLENLGLRYGFALTAAGAFECTFPEGDLNVWGAKILRLLTAITVWEEDRFSEGDTDFSLTEHVEIMLRAKDPNRKLSRNASLRVGKVDITFDFLWGDTYVDAVAPVQHSINARLRKAVLVNKSEYAVDVLFIVDDRDKKQKAEDEINVLGGISPTILLSDFQTHYSLAVH